MKQKKIFGRPDEEGIFYALLEKKIDLCKKIADSSRTLQEALASRNIDKIAEVIAQRQEYMDAVDRIDETIIRLRAQWQTDIQAETQTRMKHLTSAIEGELKIAIPLNQACERSAEQILDSHRLELQKMQQTRQAYQGYAIGRPTTARFFDNNT